MTVRHNSRRRFNDPEALAALLPDELRSFGSFASPDDWRAHAENVRAWLEHAAPGHGPELVTPVMKAAGLSVASWYRAALSTS